MPFVCFLYPLSLWPGTYLVMPCFIIVHTFASLSYLFPCCVLISFSTFSVLFFCGFWNIYADVDRFFVVVVVVKWVNGRVGVAVASIP